MNCLASIMLLLGAAGGDSPNPPAAEPPIESYFGGVGGVYFLAEPGTLTVTVEKRDRNRRRATAELRAILAGPDRRICAEATIADDGAAPGKLGPPQCVRLTARVPRKGIYVLNVTVSQDRYGEAMVWGFSTNCPHYVVETARGHRDQRHEEPIVLYSPRRSTCVAFRPRPGAFDLEVAGLKAGAPVTLRDHRGQAQAELAADANGQVKHRLAAAARGPGPWTLTLPAGEAVVQIDGLTRWDRGDPCPDICCWSPEPRSFFPWLSYRWLLTPYSRTVYGAAGEKGRMAFTVQNSSPARRTIALALEFPHAAWAARASTDRVELAPNQTAEVAVEYTMPAAGGEVHLRATPTDEPQFSTYATLAVKPGAPPAAEPLALPLVLRPYQHENEQLGYLPQYPNENQVYFDTRNRPWSCTAAGLARWRDGGWQSIDQRAVVACDPPLKSPRYTLSGSKVAFDGDGDIYVLAQADGQNALLHSADDGQSFRAYLLPGGPKRRGVTEIEEFSGHNRPAGPPAILRYVLTATDPDRIWRRIHDLELFMPRKVDGRLTLGPAQIVSRQCIGLASHSGIPTSVVSHADRVHVAWGEATDPAERLPGLPAFVRSYARGGGPLGEPVLVAHGPPANDIHNSPSITTDSKGFLHVLAGTHGKPFPYAQSRQANTAHGGFTEPVLTGADLSQTYIGLVCGPDDTLYAAFRLWQSNRPPFPHSHYAALAVQRKPAGQPWQPPQLLVVPPLSEYSVYRHRLTIDRAGRLFLSYKAWSTFWFYRNDRYGDARALLTSADGGRQWRLAREVDLIGPPPARNSRRGGAAQNVGEVPCLADDVLRVGAHRGYQSLWTP